MTIREELETTCQRKLEEAGWAGDPKYKKRLAWELGEIAAKNKSDYFWNLYSTKTRYGVNQNNLLVCKLLGICEDYSPEAEPVCEYGEYPDIDVDYLGTIRDYLKSEWAPKTFGEEFVCNIGNYTTFGIKSALIDMARVHGESREEVQALTKNLDAKDDEGKTLTWDGAMKLYPELKKYCEEHKEVADAAKRLLNRNRGMGVHAGGLIISNSPLHDLVPLVKRKDNPQASSWVEGLHGQDLQPVGLVKFDLLVISNLLQIAKCCKLVKERHGLAGVCNLEGQGDWTDVKKWRNDKTALEMADRGDLKGIFQFDKDTVRGMARQGGVTRFEDLVAYTSLNRPGPLQCLREGSRVTVSSGFKPIERLEPGHDEIAYLGPDGQVKHTNKYFVTKTGVKKILKITTRNGKVLHASPDHRILSDGGVYVRADNLKINQKIATI